jgi:hypothetical protein
MSVALYYCLKYLACKSNLFFSRIITTSVACPAVPYFSKLAHNRQDIQKKIIEHKMCVLIITTTFVWNISHSKKNSPSYYQRLHRSSCIVVIIVILKKLNFLDIFSKNSQMSFFMKIRPMGAELFYADRHTRRRQQSLSSVLRTLLKNLAYTIRPPGVEWIQISQDKDKALALVNTVISAWSS